MKKKKLARPRFNLPFRRQQAVTGNVTAHPERRQSPLWPHLCPRLVTDISHCSSHRHLTGGAEREQAKDRFANAPWRRAGERVEKQLWLCPVGAVLHFESSSPAWRQNSKLPEWGSVRVTCIVRTGRRFSKPYDPLTFCKKTHVCVK